MSNNPNFVKLGDPLRVSNYNDIVRSVRDLNKIVIPRESGNISAQRQSKPFEVIETLSNAEDAEDTNIYFRIKPGYSIHGDDYYHLYIEKSEGEGYFPIDSIPAITLQKPDTDQPTWLAVDLDTCKLFWATSDEYKSNVTYVTRFEVNEDQETGDDLYLHYNIHPENIVWGAKDHFRVTAWQTHNPLSAGDMPESCKLTINPGYVWNLIPSNAEDKPLERHSVSNGATPAVLLEAESTPVFEDVTANQIVYLKVSTDNKNKITDAPKIMIMDQMEDPSYYEDTIHYQPNPVAINGEYYYPLAQIKLQEYESTSDSYYQFYVEQLWTGDVTIQPNLIEIENVGEKREWFQTLRTADSVYEFRTAEQIDARGETIIKPLSAAVAADPEAEPPVVGSPAEEEGETIKWKRIAERSYDAQVKVTTEDSGNVVQIAGNGIAGTFANASNISLTVVDGLVTVINSVDGDDFNIEIWNQHYTINFGGGGSITGPVAGSSPTSILYVRNGLVSRTDPLDGVPTFIIYETTIST